MIVFFSADLDQFRKMCLMHFDKQSRCDDVFFIKNTPQFSTQSPFHVSYAACCKDFVDFQIDLFIETDLFPLRSVDCGNSWGRQQEDIDFDYRDMYWSDSDMFDSDDKNIELVKGHTFNSSLGCTEMRSNLMFDRFCECC